MSKVNKGEIDPATAVWRRPSRQAGDNAMEVAFVGELVAMRHAAKPEVVLLFTRAEWDAFIGGAKDGEFNI